MIEPRFDTLVANLNATEIIIYGGKTDGNGYYKIYSDKYILNTELLMKPTTYQFNTCFPFCFNEISWVLARNYAILIEIFLLNIRISVNIFFAD